MFSTWFGKGHRAVVEIDDDETLQLDFETLRKSCETRDFLDRTIARIGNSNRAKQELLNDLKTDEVDLQEKINKTKEMISTLKLEREAVKDEMLNYNSEIKETIVNQIAHLNSFLKKLELIDGSDDCDDWKQDQESAEDVVIDLTGAKRMIVKNGDNTVVFMNQFGEVTVDKEALLANIQDITVALRDNTCATFVIDKNCNVKVQKGYGVFKNTTFVKVVESVTSQSKCTLNGSDWDKVVKVLK